MTNNILNDNLAYLKEWQNQNPKLKSNLKIKDNLLILDINDNYESVDLTTLYLPELLYNEPFRQNIKDKLNSIDLFRIIKLYSQTNQILANKQD